MHGRAARIAAALLGLGMLAGCTPQPPVPPTVPRIAGGCTRPSTEVRTAGLTTVHTVPFASLHGDTITDRLDAAPRGTAVAFGTGTNAFADFAVRAGGSQVGASEAGGGIVGAGVGRTVFQMTPHTSTRAASIPTAFPATNQLSLLRVGGDHVVLSGFTLRGTAQGHLYNGLRVQGTRDLAASDLCVAGIPGDDNQPPGETFGINDYATRGSVYRRIEVDGRGVGAAGFAANRSTDLTIDGAYLHDDRYSAGATFYRTHDIVLTDVVSVRNGRIGLNFERVTGSVRIVRPRLAGNGTGDIRITTDSGAATYTIVDPVLPASGHLTVVFPPKYLDAPNVQPRSRIRVLIHGVDRTADVLRFEDP